MCMSLSWDWMKLSGFISEWVVYFVQSVTTIFNFVSAKERADSVFVS